MTFQDLSKKGMSTPSNLPSYFPGEYRVQSLNPQIHIYVPNYNFANGAWYGNLVQYQPSHNKTNDITDSKINYSASTKEGVIEKCSTSYIKKKTCEDKLEKTNAGAASQSKVQRHHCKYCNAFYYRRFQLNRHVKVTHIRPHQCEHCGKSFGHGNYLRLHIANVHMGQKNHKCSYCGKYMSTSGNLKVHEQTIHLGQRNHSCMVCHRNFGQLCNLKIHMRQHHDNATTSSFRDELIQKISS